MSKFADEVDPDRVLSPVERERRAGAARKAHFAKLALASAKSRRKTKTTAPSKAVVKEAPDVRGIDAPMA